MLHRSESIEAERIELSHSRESRRNDTSVIIDESIDILIAAAPAVGSSDVLCIATNRALPLKGANCGR
jgi:hypothetical protein